MVAGNTTLNFDSLEDIPFAADSLGFFRGGGFRGIGELPPELEELQASISALHESSEFSEVRANIEELRDGLSELRETVELPSDFPSIRGLRVNISELVAGEDSLDSVLDELLHKIR